MVSGSVRERLNSHLFLPAARNLHSAARPATTGIAVGLRRIICPYFTHLCPAILRPASRTVRFNKVINCHFDRRPSCVRLSSFRSKPETAAWKFRKAGIFQCEEATARPNNLELIFSPAAWAALSLIWKRILLSASTKLIMPPDSMN